MDSATIKIEAHCILDGRKFYFNIAGQIGRRAGPGYLIAEESSRGSSLRCSRTVALV
ncbi:MAG: hypothetical protein H6Q05_3277 [Acidobacteria bacterium]|nr:hypothetical protein [Acidobacteriota bacterium]